MLMAAVGSTSLGWNAAADLLNNLNIIDQGESSELKSELSPLAVRPFKKINFPEEALVYLRRRIAATRLPEWETVNDQSQGVQLATIQKLAYYERQITIGR